MVYTIVIADDHDIIREGIKSILEYHSEYEVYGEAQNADQTVEQVHQIKPDILLLDISMPKKSGLDIIETIKRISSSTKIIILTVHKMGAYILKALDSGVNGYFNKDNAAEELIPALSRVVSGGTYLGSSASQYLAQEFGGQRDKTRGATEVLNSRERDILRLVAEGKTARQISQTLFLSIRTVENYKNNMLKKLNLHKTSDLIRYAIENKIVE